MLTMRKGFSISFADKLSEGYKTDGKLFTANVSAQKTLPLLEDFIKLHENERLFFILELPTPQTAEPKDENGNIIAFHKDIYYLDDCTSAMIRDVLDIVGKILLDDGISQFGVGSHITNDEMMICKYNIVNLYRNDEQSTLMTDFSKMPAYARRITSSPHGICFHPQLRANARCANRTAGQSMIYRPCSPSLECIWRKDARNKNIHSVI